jgi:CPA1 family monovalent cation:H+ antiporter
MAPEFVLLLVLPPIIYWSAVAMSWREFKFNLRPISFLAVGAVLFTTGAVAAAAHWLLGLPWAVGCVLGAIVSPPDAVAPLAIARRMRMPRRLLVILEAEGLGNDATALILYRFAVAAVSLGTFSLLEAAGTFAAIVAGEIVWGLGIGWMMLRLRHWVREPRIEITLMLLTPFVAYWPPQHLGGSGVLATVTTGLYISWKGPRLISAGTRLQGIFFGDLLIYLIEGLVFLTTGLQARTVIASVANYSIAQLATSAALISAVVIAVRFIYVFPLTYLPRCLLPSLRRRDPAPPWQWPFAIAFIGIRGIVSLAAALAIPLTTTGGAPFPHRDLILLLTFSVILVTLVGQGLLFPWVIRALGLAQAGHREHVDDRREEVGARRQAIEAAIARLDQLAAERQLPAEIVAPLRARHHDRLTQIDYLHDDDAAHHQFADYHGDLESLLIAAERSLINDLYRDGQLKDEARRRIERELDLREAHLANERARD